MGQKVKKLMYYFHLFCLLAHSCSAHSRYRDNIPNGDLLAKSGLLSYVGHYNLETKQLNWFGFDFAGNGYFWTKELCWLDSDGDGQSNGLELGDPECTWSAEKQNAGGVMVLARTDLSHPGDPNSTTNRTMNPDDVNRVTSHTPVVPHSGYTSLSYVLIPLGLSALFGLVLTNVPAISDSVIGHNLLQKRLGTPRILKGTTSSTSSSLKGATKNRNSERAPRRVCWNECAGYCRSELSARAWAVDLLVGELMFLFAVIIGLACLVANKQWNGKYRIANTLGQLAGTLCFLVVLPASRSAMWVWVFGIPFERAIKWHRLFGKLFVISTYLHLFFILLKYGPRMLGDSIQWGPTVDAPYPYWGLVSGIATTLVGITAVEAVRRKSFELFYFVHVPVVQVVAIGAIFHAPGPEYRYPVIIAMIFYFFDVLGRFTWRSVNVMSTKIIDPNCCGVVKIRVVTRHALVVGPGDYFFLRFPQLSFLQQHPFSVSSIGPHPNDINFVIKSMGDGTFTDQLRKFVGSSSNPPLATTMEGPYGHLSIKLEHYNMLWICCGGIGAAPMINILLQLHERVEKRDPTLMNLKDVHFCWVVRSCGELKWYEEELAQVQRRRSTSSSVFSDDDGEIDTASGGVSGGVSGGGTKFHVHLYVTGSMSSREADEVVAGDTMLLSSQSRRGASFEDDEEIEIEIELPSIDSEEGVCLAEAEEGDVYAGKKDENGDDKRGMVDNSSSGGSMKEYRDGRPSYMSLFGVARPVARPDGHAALLACGPSSMVASCQHAAMERGWDVHKETFEF